MYASTTVLFHSPGAAAANAVSPKMLYVRVSTHVWLALERRVVAHEHRQQDGSRRGSGTVPDLHDLAPPYLSELCDCAPVSVV